MQTAIKGLSGALRISSPAKRLKYLIKLNPTIPVSQLELISTHVSAAEVGPRLAPIQNEVIATQVESLSKIKLRQQQAAVQTLQNLRSYTEEFNRLPLANNPLYHAAYRIKNEVKIGKRTDETSLEIAAMFEKYAPGKTVATIYQQLQEYIQLHGKFPPSTTPLYRAVQQIERKVAAREMSDEDALALVELAQQYHTPSFKKQSRDLLTQLQSFLYKHGHLPAPNTELYQTALKVHLSVKTGEVTDVNSRQVSKVFEENLAKKTPSYWRSELKKYIRHHGHLPPSTSGLYHNAMRITQAVHTGIKKDPASKEIAHLMKMYRSHAPSKSLEEVYEDFITYLSQHTSYPASNSPLYTQVFNRLHKPLEEIQANPILYNLYKANQLARAKQHLSTLPTPTYTTSLAGLPLQRVNTAVELGAEHIQFITDENTLSAWVLDAQVSGEDIQTTLKHLLISLPYGWEAKMGVQEIIHPNELYIRFEPAEPNAEELGYVLRVDTQAVVAAKNAVQQYKTIKKLFGSYFEESIYIGE